VLAKHTTYNHSTTENLRHGNIVLTQHTLDVTTAAMPFNAFSTTVL